MTESLFTTETPDSGNGDLADLGGGGKGGTTATTLVFAANGTVAGIRFWAPATVSGLDTFTGELWSPTSTDGAGGTGTGTRLAAKSVSGSTITPSAWNNILFDATVSVTAGLPYRHAVHNTAGRYVARVGYFSSDHTNGSITGYTSPHDFGGSVGSLRTANFAAATDANNYPTSFFGSPTYLIDTLFTVTAANTFSGTLTETFTATGTLGTLQQASGSAAVDMTISGSMSVSTPATPGQSGVNRGWWGWKNIWDEARAEATYLSQREPLSCPNDGEPLVTAPDGRLFCPFDGWPNV